MTATVIVTTYDRPAALALVLQGLADQTVIPAQVIVADDGSSGETGALVRRMEERFPAPLGHVWQEHHGFRAGRIRNRALGRARGPYVILLDGDCLPHPAFVEDHLTISDPGCFVRGPRVFLSPARTAALLGGRTSVPRWWEPGLTKRGSAIRLTWLARALRDRRPAGRSGHNLACWLEDAVRINGFDERFQGWGREDDEFAQRLIHAGVRKRRLRFAGLTYHLHHDPSPREELARNDALLAETIRTRRVRAEIGLAELSVAGDR